MSLVVQPESNSGTSSVSGPGSTLGGAQILALAWPIAMNALLLQAILVIDTTLVAPLGETTVAAMGLATSVLGIVVGILFALANGAQILLAQGHGAGNIRGIRAAFWCGLILNVTVAFVSIVVLYSTAQNLLNALATTSEMGQLAWQYTRVFLLVIAGVAICQIYTVYFNATGNSRIPFYSNLLELPFNVLLSYSLIHGAYGLPELGLEGAAWGSALAVGIRAVFLTVCLYFSSSRILDMTHASQIQFYALFTYHWRHTWPVAATYITMSLSLSLCMMMYASLPVHEFAALTILFLWVRVSGIVVTSWGQASGILVGQLLGRKQNKYLDQFVSRAWRLAFVFAFLVALLNATSSYGFRFIYPQLQGPTLDVLSMLAPLFILLPLFRTSNVMCGNVLRAGGDAEHVFKIHVGTQILFTLPLTALMVFYFQLNAVYVFALVLAEEIVKAVPFHLRLRGDVWRRRLEFN